MSDIIEVALITSIPPTLVALTGLIVSLNNRKKIKSVHEAVNSGLTRQLETAQKLGNAEGRAEQTEENKPHQQ